MLFRSLHKKVGDHVEQGESLATIYANDPEKCRVATERFLKAYEFSENPVKKQKMIRGMIE